MAAHSPQQVHELFAQYFSAGDLDALMSLYAVEATMALRSGSQLDGLTAIREHLAGFLALGCRMELAVARMIQVADTALLLSNWTIHGTDQVGQTLESAGQTTDVVRRQPDGTWLLVIDNPYGAAAA